VKAAEWSNSPNRVFNSLRQSPPKHGRTTWLPSAANVAIHFDDFTAKTPMKYTVLLVTI